MFKVIHAYIWLFIFICYIINLSSGGDDELDCYEVKEIPYSDTKDFILNKHYAQRMPSISFSYGLFKETKMVGVLTIGKPASNSLCKGICGLEYTSKVYELNRLITLDGLEKNSLSFFVGKVLKDLKKENIVIVSYADTGAGHNGYIYQATNFIYTGKTKQRTDKYTEGNKHSRHYGEGNEHLRKLRTAKHRYVYFTNKKKEWLKVLKYPVLEYPKGNNVNYVLGERLKTKVINKKTGIIVEV